MKADRTAYRLGYLLGQRVKELERLQRQGGDMAKRMTACIEEVRPVVTKHANDAIAAAAYIEGFVRFMSAELERPPAAVLSLVTAGMATQAREHPPFVRTVLAELRARLRKPQKRRAS
jgi:hypothetical protein